MNLRRFFLPCFLLLLHLPLWAENAQVFDRIQNALQTQNMKAYMELFASDPALQKLETKFFNEYVAFQSTRTVMQLVDSKEGRLNVVISMQAEEEARFESWSLDIGQEGDRTVILSRDVISSVDGLYRLRMTPAAYPVNNLEIRHFDAIVKLDNGSLFPILAQGEIAGALFLGRGSFTFSPRDPTEQQQVNLFCKKPNLEVALTSYYIRGSAALLKKYLGPVLSTPPEPNAELYEKAQELSQSSDRNEFGVRIPFSDQLWFPRLQTGDLYSEIDSNIGKLLYQFAPNELEDIMLADRTHDRIVSLYSSQGRGYHGDLAEDFNVLSYKMNLKYQPQDMYLSGTSDVLILCRIPTSTIVFKLNPALRVSTIESDQGSLLYQEKSTNNLHVVLNEMADEGAEVRLLFTYQGKINPDRGRAEMQSGPGSGAGEFFIPPTFLYSNQAIWYPQLLSKPYSQVETTITIPDGFAAIANGELKGLEEKNGFSTYSYSADLPVKYFSMLVGRLRANFTKQSLVPVQVYYYSIDKSNASKQADSADKILRYYSEYFGRYPYRNLNLALRPAEEPGGHAPAGIVIANRVYSYMRARFEPDPLYIPGFPDFLLAHEIAHQWFGQAVGWRNYRDQWLSEGFAQFAAAEYIRKEEGDKAWLKLSEEFRKWIEEKTDAGPLVLGTRLGHLTGDPRAFSALLYNKGAYVLNMLKNWIGPENFQKCLAEFYTLYQFKRAGIEDFIAVAQRYSDDDLGPFFEQWLYGWTVPAVAWDWSTEGTAEGQVLHVHFKQDAHPYVLKVPVEARDKSGQIFRIQALVNQADQTIDIPLSFTPASVQVDPLHENLAEYLPQKH